MKITASETDLYVYVDVTDTNLRLPESWPGVLGSCIEFFFDFRNPNQAAYGPGVHQLVVQAPTTGEGGLKLWEPTAHLKPLQGVEVAGHMTDPTHYWMSLKIPLDGETLKRTFGFDVGVNAPPAGTAGRKTQMMLFGTSSNSVDASNFARVHVAHEPK